MGKVRAVSAKFSTSTTSRIDVNGSWWHSESIRVVKIQPFSAKRVLERVLVLVFTRCRRRFAIARLHCARVVPGYYY